MQMRRKVEYDENYIPPKKHRFLVNQLYITDACNCSCPICYMAPNMNNSYFMSVEEVVSRVKLAKCQKTEKVILIGGEPTIHPDIIEIIKAIRKLKVKVLIATNGLKLAEDNNFAYKLKKAGLYSVSLQFDTLNRTTLKKMRGYDDIGLKFKAIENIQKANLRYGLICTVSSFNENEIGDLIKWAIDLPTLPRFFPFQTMAEIGRFPLEAKKKITREKIIKNIITSGCLPGAKTENFWPIPFFQPLGYFVHPDCAANLFVVRDKKKIFFLDNLTDLSSLFKDMRKAKLKDCPKSALFIAIYLLIKNTRFKNISKILKCFLPFQNPKKQNDLMMIGTGGFVSQNFEDTQRISRCGAAVLTEKGNVSLCSYFSRGCRISC
jgi:uncharacterized radical SAM superfamily Fe-S cluster-containing enzyme